jgi:conjugative relaxase-like TrwC/TraI family protein
MLNMTKLDSGGRDSKSGGNVLEYLKATEYYLGQDGQAKSSSRFVGAGTQALGLEGEVKIEIMEALARGEAPDGTGLRQNAGKGDRVGWDLTFSADNTVSIVFAAALPEERERILAGHRAASSAAIEYLEGVAQVRTGKGGSGPLQSVKGLVATGHTHFSAREEDGFHAAQLHEHVLVYNIAQGEDGNWRALDTTKMCQHQRAAGALYRAAMAQEMQKLGYGIEAERKLDSRGRETGDVYYHIAGISQAAHEQFSKRHKAVLDYQEKHGGSRQAAVLATRKSKDEPTFKELVDTWDSALNQLREKDPTMFRSVAELKGRQNKLLEIDDNKSLERLHSKEAKFSKADLIERLALENVGRMSPKEIVAEADKFLARNKIQELAPAQNRNRMKSDEREFSAQWMLDREHEIGARGVARMSDDHLKLSHTEIAKAVQRFTNKNGFAPSDEQVRSADWVGVETGGLAIVSGRAGTGKTTSADIWIDALKTSGREVIGTSTSWQAAKKLQAETGLESVAITKLLGDLERGKRTFNKNTVLVVDEAGMVGTNACWKLQNYIDACGGKLVLVGDIQQLQAIEAGSPMRQLIDKVGHTRLTEIRRQVDPEDRKTAALMYDANSGFQKLQRLEDRGQVRHFDTRKAAIEQLANEWMSTTAPAREKIAIGGTNNEVKLINQALRSRLQHSGEVGPDAATFDADNGKAIAKLTLGKGDRVRFTANDEERGYYNNLNAVVSSIQPGKVPGSFRIALRTESDVKKFDERLVVIDTSEVRDLALGYGMTVHKSQGQGVNHVFHLASPQMTDKHLQLVAFSRAKVDYKLYGSESDIQELAHRFGRENLKVNATDQLPTPKIEQVAERQPERDGFRRLLDDRRRREVADLGR